MSDNLFAYTEPGGDYPGYVSVNADDDSITITVRATPHATQIAGYPGGCVEVSPGSQVCLTIPADTPEANILNTCLSSPPPAVGGEVEQLGEALFRLSDRLRKSGFLDDDANHAAYENVVAAFQALTPQGGQKP